MDFTFAFTERERPIPEPWLPVPTWIWGRFQTDQHCGLFHYGTPTPPYRKQAVWPRPNVPSATRSLCSADTPDEEPQR